MDGDTEQDQRMTAETECDFVPVEGKDYDPPPKMGQQSPMEDNKKDSGVYDSLPVQYKIYNEEDNSEQVSVRVGDDDYEESLGQTQCTVYEDPEDSKM